MKDLLKDRSFWKSMSFAILVAAAVTFGYTSVHQHNQYTNNESIATTKAQM